MIREIHFSRYSSPSLETSLSIVGVVAPGQAVLELDDRRVGVRELLVDGKRLAVLR
jgi:hypothetical protein